MWGDSSSSGMRECQEGVVNIESVDGSTFKHILDYIYKGRLDGVDDLDCMADIYMAADMFQMPDLIEQVLLTALRSYSCKGKNCKC